MTLPIIRKNVFFSLDGKNISLSDLRGSTYAAIEILSVEPYDGKIYNTKVIARVDTWKIQDELQQTSDQYVDRVCLYSRSQLSDIIPLSLIILNDDLGTTLNFLKQNGFDINEDDIYLDDAGIVYASETSLGYIGDLSNHSYSTLIGVISIDGEYVLIGNDDTQILIEENGNASN